MQTDPRSPFFQLAASLATVQADAYRLTHDLTPPTPPPALVAPEAAQPRKRVTERDYARAGAASAIVRAVRLWRESKAGMSNTDPADALDRVFEAGEAYDALCAED